jgi:hypothetical protein
MSSEIIAGPLEVYSGPVGEGVPDISDAPAGNWALIGSNGSQNYHEDGVTITHEQTLEFFRPLGLAAPVKAFRTEEDLVVSFMLVDLLAAEYAKALDEATVTDTAAGAGTGGTQSFPMERGTTVNQVSLLLRLDQAANGGAFDSQWWIPTAVQSSSPELAFVKGEPVAIEFEYRALRHATNGLGTFYEQDEAAS